MGSRSIHWVGRALRKMGHELLRYGQLDEIWIDVGAHHGEISLGQALSNPNLTVYAFEPNLAAVSKLMGRAPNMLVIPMAVAETDGCADFHVSHFEEASSLLPMREEGLRSWIGAEPLKLAHTVKVPTIRLDTFMGITGIQKVDYLKIDAQGADLAVLKSAGSRLPDIRKITLEVAVSREPLYLNSASKDEVLRFANSAGFELVRSEKQSQGQEENLTFLRAVRASSAMMRESR